MSNKWTKDTLQWKSDYYLYSVRPQVWFPISEKVKLINVYGSTW